MKILIDVTRSPRTGIGNYSWNLLTYLKRNNASHEFIGLTFAPLVQYADSVSVKHLVINHNPTNQQEVDALSNLIDSSCDIYIPTNFSQITNPRVPIIQVVHDLIYTLNPQWQPTENDLETRHGAEMMEFVYQKYLPNFQELKKTVRGKWSTYGYDSRVSRMYAFAQTFSISRASGLIAVSNTTQNIIKEYYYIDKPIETIYPVILEDGWVRQDSRNEIVRRQYMFVYIAGFEPRKNHRLLFDALCLLPEEIRKKITLVLVGRGLYDSHFLAIKELMQEFTKHFAIDWRSDLTEVEKSKLLLEADFMIYPSLEEGFGIPLLEAMIHNLPIIAYSTPAAQEVCGDNAIYYYDSSPKTLMETIQASIMNKDYIRQGKLNLQKQIRKFQPTDVAAKLNKIIAAITS